MEMLRYLLFFFFFIGIQAVASAQPANDDCMNAIGINGPFNGGCTVAFDNTGSTPDIFGGSCFPSNNNMWFSFVAEGVDLNIDVVTGGAYGISIQLVEFTANACEFAGSTELGCGSGGASDVLDVTGLVIGNTYYLNVTMGNQGGYVDGTVQLCITNVDNPVPPNDLPCDAVNIAANGSCIGGTTENATIDFSNVSTCADVPSNGVFYSFTATAGNLVANVDLNNLTISGEISVAFGQFQSGCNDAFTVFDVYCGSGGVDIFSDIFITAGETYYIWVATLDDPSSGDFELCVTQSGPPPGCSVNNDCNSAEVIPNVVTGPGNQVCVDGCNILASPFPTSPAWPCALQDQEVVWYEITTDGNADLLNVEVTGLDIEAPVLSVVQWDCNGTITPISNCVTGTNFTAGIGQLTVAPNTSYYILVGTDFGTGGEFELCVLTSEDVSACVLEAELIVSPGSPTFGSPDDGPFLPGETVTFCYSINDYTASGNNCQWLQGIVPIFGDAWDLGSFNPFASMPPTLYGGTWNWYATGITYKTNNPAITIDDFDGDGDIDICHFQELNCSNVGTVPGQMLPPGWFAAQNNGNPNSQYGDGGPGCPNSMGVWSFCFDITTNDFPTCDADGITDASLSVYTFADGETGLWGVQNPTFVSVCGNDTPSILELSLNCCEGPTVEPVTLAVCPGDQITIPLESNPFDPDATFTWTAVDNPNTTGETDGAGVFITDVVINNTTSTQFVTYEVIATTSSGCPGMPFPIMVEILPALEVDAGEPIDGCAQGSFTLGGSPTASGGSGSNYMYDWTNSALDDVSNPEASPNLSTIYTVIVTDGNGCTSSDQVELTISPNFDIEITGDTILCPGDAVTNLTGSPLGGSPNYSFDWDPPSGSNFNGQVFPFNGNGVPPGDYVITLTVTDNNGCTGDKEVLVDILFEPSVFIASTPPNGQFCPGGSVILQSAVVGGEPGANFTYNWTSPEGNTLNGNMITATESGVYMLEVFDDILGCMTPQTFTVEEVAPPTPEIDAPAGICGSDLILISTTEIYETYEWGGGEITDSILVGPGSYEVTVTNSAGCEGVTNITVNPLPDANVTIGGSSTFCIGSSSTLSVGDEFSTFEWTDINGDVISTADTAFVTTEGEFFVMVIDSNGCTATSSLEVQIQDFLVPNIAGDTSICPLDCTVLNAGSGYVSYEWSTAEETQMITVCTLGTYGVTVYDAGGCSGEQILEVTENDIPTPQILGENGAISFCPGDDLQLDAGSGYSTYNWSTTESNQTITVSEAGTYFVTVTDGENCEGVTEITIEENIPPSPQFSGDVSFCPGDSVLITPEAGYDLYEIDTDNNGSVDITNTGNEPFYVSLVGNSNIIVTDANGCTGSVIVEVDEFVSPTPVSQTDTSSYCVNGSVFIGITENFAQVDWYLNNVNVGSGQSIQVDVAGTYEVLVADANGCTGQTIVEVIESDQLFPAIAGETAICDSNPITLDAGQGYDTYDWGVFGNTQTIDVTTEGVYIVTVTDLGGCSGTAEVIVTESVSPSATVEEEFFTCNNSNGDNTPFVSFNGLISGSQGIWTDTDGTGVDLTDLSNVDFTDVPPGFYTFDYETSIAIEPCQDVMYSTTIEVGECLCPSVSINGLLPICLDGNIVDLDTLKITSESGFWTVDQGPGNVLTGSIFDPAEGSGGIYTLTFNLDEAAENCDSTQSINVELIAPPMAGIAEEPIVICVGLGETVDLGILLTGEDSGGQWTETSLNTSTGGAFNSNAGSFNSTDQIVGSYTFEYFLEGDSPCGDASNEVEIEIVPSPTADAGEDKLLNCDLLVVEVGTNNSSGNGLNYNWTEEKGLVISNPNSPIIDVTEAGIYMLEITDENNCIDSDTAVVDQNMNFPDVAIEGINPFCNNESTGVIIATGSGGQGPYTYSLDNGLNFTEANAFMDLPPGNYNVIVQDQNSCTEELTIQLDNPAPYIADIGNDIIVQNIEDTLITLNVPGGLDNFGAAIWTVNDSIVCQGADCTSYRVDLEEDADVCVVVTSPTGCIDSTCIQIRSIVINTSYTGNVFSPDDDGINDVFYVQGDDILSVNHFRVFNRWGEKMFEVEEFPPNNPIFGWAGTFKNEKVNPGVYVYTMEVVYLTGETELITGDVTIVK